MEHYNPAEITNVDKRGDITGPDDDKANYPKSPKHVQIGRKKDQPQKD